MSVSINLLLSDRIIKRSTIISLVLLVIAVIYIGFLYRSLPPYVPVYNQLPWGTARLGDKIALFFPVGFAFSILLVNMSFSLFVYEKMPLVVRMLGLTTLFITFIMFIFVIRTTLLIL